MQCPSPLRDTGPAWGVQTAPPSLQPPVHGPHCSACITPPWRRGQVCNPPGPGRTAARAPPAPRAHLLRLRAPPPRLTLHRAPPGRKQQPRARDGLARAAGPGRCWGGGGITGAGGCGAAELARARARRHGSGCSSARGGGSSGALGGLAMGGNGAGELHWGEKGGALGRGLVWGCKRGVHWGGGCNGGGDVSGGAKGEGIGTGVQWRVHKGVLGEGVAWECSREGLCKGVQKGWRFPRGCTKECKRGRGFV